MSATHVLRSLLQSLPSSGVPSTPIPSLPPTLRCMHCQALLYQPTTLGNGISLCLGCVSKQKADLLYTGIDLHFGQSENKVLAEISKKCAPALYAAAKMRHESNDLFRNKQYLAAIEGYTKAIELYSLDAVVWGNRAATYMQLHDYASALADVQQACTLLLVPGVAQDTATSAIMLKVLCRKVSCLEKIAVMETTLKETSNETSNETPKETSNETAINTTIDTHIDHMTMASLYLLILALYQEIGRTAPKTIKSSAQACVEAFTTDSSTETFETCLAQHVGATKFLSETTRKEIETPTIETATTTRTKKRQRKEWKFDDPTQSFLRVVLADPLGHTKSTKNYLSNSDHLLLLDTTKLSIIQECLRCPLCFELFHEPTTLPCGHVLCRPCLARTLDHAFDSMPSCPMCRHTLAPLLGWLNQRARIKAIASNDKWSHGGRQICVTYDLDCLLQYYFPKECAANRVRYEQDESAATTTTKCGTTTTTNNNNNYNTTTTTSIPIFCCSVALPGIRTALHVFEPRYRLMMRRCIESGQKKFGMCLSPLSEYGTMLRILHYEQLADGRAKISCIGEEIFHVVRWGEKDGYKTGDVEWLNEAASETENAHSNDATNLQNTNSIIEQVQKMRLDLKRVLAPSVWLQVESVLGEAPLSDVPFIYWVSMMLAAFQILPEDKVYAVGFGEAMDVSVVDDSPCWKMAEDDRPTLRASHAERVKVVQIYVDAIVAASDENMSR